MELLKTYLGYWFNRSNVYFDRWKITLGLCSSSWVIHNNKRIWNWSISTLLWLFDFLVIFKWTFLLQVSFIGYIYVYFLKDSVSNLNFDSKFTKSVSNSVCRNWLTKIVFCNRENWFLRIKIALLDTTW